MQVFLSHSQQTSFVSEQARMDINKGETVLSTVRCLRDFFFATLQERNGNETPCRQADKQTGVGHCRCHIFTQCQVRFKCAKDVTEMQIYRPRTAQTKAVYEMLLNRSPLSLESCRVMSSDVESSTPVTRKSKLQVFSSHLVIRPIVLRKGEKHDH